MTSGSWLKMASSGFPKVRSSAMAAPRKMAPSARPVAYTHRGNSDYYSQVCTAPGRRASDCLQCGKCEKVCPQHLPIRELLKEVAGVFEKPQA